MSFFLFIFTNLFKLDTEIEKVGKIISSLAAEVALANAIATPTKEQKIIEKGQANKSKTSPTLSRVISFFSSFRSSTVSTAAA